jgi:hypothetical protein
LVDWCWLIAKIINPENTGIRQALNTEDDPMDSAKNTAKNEAPLHQQTDSIRATTHTKIEQLSPENISHAEQATAEPRITTVDPINKKTNDTGMIDAELVNALEKLVHLKQQGFLSLEEFTQAKAKLLNNLIDS